MSVDLVNYYDQKCSITFEWETIVPWRLFLSFFFVWGGTPSSVLSLLSAYFCSIDMSPVFKEPLHDFDTLT